MDDLSTIKTDIDLNRVKIETEAKISEERNNNIISLIQSVKTVQPPIPSEIIVQPPVQRGIQWP